MKKLFYLMALAALTGVVYTSCDEDDDKDNGVKVTLTEPATKDLAAKYNLHEKVAIGNYLISEIEVTEENGIIFTYEEASSNAAATRAEADRPEKLWKWYSFTKDGDKLLITGLGSIVIKTSDGQYVYVELLPDGYESPLEVMADMVKPSLDDQLSGYFCRTWNIYEYRLLANVDKTNVGTGWKKINGDCNLYEIMKDINENHNADLDLDLNGKDIVESITITANGTFQIKYKGLDDMDEGSWNWLKSSMDFTNMKGSITYSWYDERMGNDMLGGAADVAFKDETCTLSLSAKAGKSCNVTLQFRMK